MPSRSPERSTACGRRPACTPTTRPAASTASRRCWTTRRRGGGGVRARLPLHALAGRGPASRCSPSRSRWRIGPRPGPRHPHPRGVGRHLRHPRRRGGARSARCSTASPAVRTRRGGASTLGAHLSFSGIVTFPSAPELRDAAALLSRSIASWSRPTRPTWHRCPIGDAQPARSGRGGRRRGGRVRGVDGRRAGRASPRANARARSTASRPTTRERHVMPIGSIGPLGRTPAPRPRRRARLGASLAVTLMALVVLSVGGSRRAAAPTTPWCDSEQVSRTTTTVPASSTTVYDRGAQPDWLPKGSQSLQRLGRPSAATREPPSAVHDRPTAVGEHDHDRRAAARRPRRRCGTGRPPPSRSRVTMRPSPTTRPTATAVAPTTPAARRPRPRRRRLRRDDRRGRARRGRAPPAGRRGPPARESGPPSAQARLGQNFVVDPGTIRRIVRLAGIDAGRPGARGRPGLGSLTLGLLEAGAAVTAIEKDAGWSELLRDTSSGAGPRGPRS